MSTGGQIAGGVVGGVIGAVVGGPTGAIYGAQIGMSVGGLLDPPKGPTVEGPRLSDLSVQTSTYGQFIPRTYGTIGLSGNVFWLENNKLKEVVKKEKSGGKGGGSSSTVKTYTYFATFAVGLCEGPIAGVRRIWVGPDLVYDAGSDDLETIISSNQASSKFTIYLGTDTQQPDPRMQAEMGVADCPAYRGLAYIVFKDLALANYGNSVAGAQVKVEVVNSQTESSAQVQAATVLAPRTQDYGASYPGGTDYNPLFVCWNPAPYDLLRLTSSGRLSDELSPAQAAIHLDGYEPLITSPASVDDLHSVWSLIGTGTENLRFYDGSAFKDYTTPYDLITNNIYERNGDIWFSWIGDSNSAEPWASGRYYAKFNKSDIAGVSWLTYTDKRDMLASTVCAVDMNGRLVHVYLPTFIEGVAGTITITILNEDATEYSNGSISATMQLGRSGPNSLSAAYVDDSGILHLVLTAYTVIDDPALYGKYNYLQINLDDMQISSQRVLSATGLDDALRPVDIIRVEDGVLYLAGFHDSTPADLWRCAFSVRAVEPGLIPLPEILESEFYKSSLITTGDIDEISISDSVTGFKVTATGSIRNAIEPLRGAWPFDVVQSGYKIRAASRGGASVVTIPVGELSIDTQLTESREMDSQLPQNVTVKYIDRDRDYDTNEQRAQRDNTEAVNSLVLELPVVLSADQSAQVAEKLIRIYALEKSDFSFTLPPPYRYLEPGDVVTIATDDADYVLRLVSVNQTADGRLECAGRPSSASTYTSIAPGDGVQTGGATIPLAGSTVGILIDCPVIDEGLQDAPGFAVGMNGYSSGWPGGILFRTADNGQTWDDLQALAGRATAGFAENKLDSSAGNLIQRGGSLTVSLIGGELESVTEVQMLNGANIAAYGVNGRWEIIRFQNAALNTDGTYTLDTFWRGDKGTEWATGLHDEDDYFVLMTDLDLAFVGMPTDSIGQPRDYRSVTAGADIDSAASVSFTYDATNLETLSGVHPRGSRSTGDLTVSWQRRTRVGGAWRDYVDASLGEAAQAYEVDIMDGSTVKRTISAVTPTVLYTDAMQVADFGSTQSSVTVNIYQLSAVVGRGYKLEVTL